MTIQRMEHVGIVVDDLAAATEFFVELGLELQGEGPVEGRWVDRVVRLDGGRAEIAILQTPDGRPERAAFLTFAARLPEARRSGAGLALTNAGLTWTREQGYPVTVVDWRETNLLASRFWPARGFRRTFLRLYRSVP
jgi:ribosomal protein S18 acetylase RimI-like enzyme